MVTGVVVSGGKAFELHERQCNRIADGQHDGDGCAGCTVDGAGLLDIRTHVEEHVRKVPQRRINVSRDINTSIGAEIVSYLEHLDHFVRLAAGRKRNNTVPLREHAKITMASLCRMYEESRCAG